MPSAFRLLESSCV